MATVMIVLVWGRIKRVQVRLQALLLRFQQGRLRVGGPGGRGCSGPRGGGGVALPRRFGWLLPLVPFEAACFAGQIRAVLAEPEMVALLAAAPQARRVLGPVCRMLGIEADVLAVGGPGSGGGSSCGEAGSAGVAAGSVVLGVGASGGSGLVGVDLGLGGIWLGGPGFVGSG